MVAKFEQMMNTTSTEICAASELSKPKLSDVKTKSKMAWHFQEGDELSPVFSVRNETDSSKEALSSCQPLSSTPLVKREFLDEPVFRNKNSEAADISYNYSSSSTRSSKPVRLENSQKGSATILASDKKEWKQESEGIDSKKPPLPLLKRVQEMPAVLSVERSSIHPPALAPKATLPATTAAIPTLTVTSHRALRVCERQKPLGSNISRPPSKFGTPVPWKGQKPEEVCVKYPVSSYCARTLAPWKTDGRRLYPESPSKDSSRTVDQSLTTHSTAKEIAGPKTSEKSCTSNRASLQEPGNKSTHQICPAVDVEDTGMGPRDAVHAGNAAEKTWARNEAVKSQSLSCADKDVQEWPVNVGQAETDVPEWSADMRHSDGAAKSTDKAETTDGEFVAPVVTRER
jgi:hypothetical protein